MFSRLLYLTILAAVSKLVAASPLLEARQSISKLTAAQVESFKKYTHYAVAAYCDPSQTKTWKCGVHCDFNSGFQPLASGGDGALIQYWYVGYDRELESIVVGFQGTTPEKILPIITDVNTVPAPLNPHLFPGVTSLALAHLGFQSAHALSSGNILEAVQTALVALNTTKTVTVVGHSLGGAIAILSSAHLKLHLPPAINIKTYSYAVPRVGNTFFARFANAQSTMTRINNKKDPVPILPLRLQGFAHTEGEIHITEETGEWVSCTGQDNPHELCTVGTVPTPLHGDVADHSGPFDGVMAGC